MDMEKTMDRNAAGVADPAQKKANAKPQIAGRIVTCVVDGKEQEIQVLRHLPYGQRRAAAQYIASQVVRENGVYEPWKKPLLLGLCVMTFYARMKIPESWNDDNTAAFMLTDGYREIRKIVDAPELLELEGWVNELVEYRKTCFGQNSFDRIVNALKGVAGTVGEAMRVMGDISKTNPDFFKNVNFMETLALVLDAAMHGDGTDEAGVDQPEMEVVDVPGPSEALTGEEAPDVVEKAEASAYAGV